MTKTRLLIVCATALVPVVLWGCGAAAMSKATAVHTSASKGKHSNGSRNCRSDTSLARRGRHALQAVASGARQRSASAQRTVNGRNAAAPAISKRLLFEDNFDGGRVNLDDWVMYDSPGHAKHGLRRPSAFSQSHGSLVITATWDGTNITSGGMRHCFDQAYGTYEVRVRTEADRTAQLSGVVLTWPGSNHKFPDGENDIYETGHLANRNPFYSYIHYNTDGRTDRKYRFVQAADATQWHIMRMDWTAASIKIYRDGVLVGKLTDTPAIPDAPHHLGIQLDAFSNNPLPGPVKMYVDWARVYG